jgi:GNAT superfamily N-acetyltransferase
MSIAISVVESKAELKKFIRFPEVLYRGNRCWVPPLIRDEIETLTPGRNPAFENAEARCFLARREGRIVGRVAGILNRGANEKYGTRNLRFSWFDTIDDFEVASALIGAVEDWGRQKGMVTLTGPHSFTDLDPEGVLVEGFEELATISVFYNHPYYAPLLERLGFTKEVDYVEFQALAPKGTVIPEKMIKLSEWAARRNGFRLQHFTDIKALRRERGQELFELVDEAFDELYGTIPLTQKQKDYYIGKYLPFANPEFIKIVLNDQDVMVGFLLSIPSLAKALQKARGRLFPFGFFHIMRALKKYDTLDFLMAGVKKEYRGKGIDLMMTIDVFRSALARGVRLAESNPELETNAKIQNEWKVVETRQHKRRRIYKKSISQA